MNNNFLNYYQLLDVATDATTSEIILAYKIKAKTYHPDKNDGHHTAKTLFQFINQAKEVLTNPSKRLAYDYSTGVKQKPKPKAKIKEKVVYVREENNDLGELLTIGAIGLVSGFMISKMVGKRKTKRLTRK